MDHLVQHKTLNNQSWVIMKLVSIQASFKKIRLNHFMQLIRRFFIFLQNIKLEIQSRNQNISNSNRKVPLTCWQYCIRNITTRISVLLLEPEFYDFINYNNNNLRPQYFCKPTLQTPLMWNKLVPFVLRVDFTIHLLYPLQLNCRILSTVTRMVLIVFIPWIMLYPFQTTEGKVYCKTTK